MTASHSRPPAPGFRSRTVALVTAAATVAVAISLTTARPATAAFDPAAVRLDLAPVADGFDRPLLVTHAGDGSGRLFVVEQTGAIRIVRGGTTLAAPFLDLSRRITSGGERGLLGLAFHPRYESNRKLYVDYTDLSGNTVVAEFRTLAGDPDRADPASIRVLLRIAQPYPNHNGGHLAFGPDGFLYIGTGDGGSAGDPGNRAQSLTSRLGKLLRIDVDRRTGALRYGIPASNPYVGRAGVDEIWARGLRNPWRFSFDRATGDLWIGDVGQGRWEEIDRSTRASGGGRARNYGWRTMEGRSCYLPASGCSRTGRTLPIAVYSHDLGCSVTGGHVYRGSESPLLRGAYIFADYCSGRIWGLVANGPPSQTPRLLRDTGLAISSFGEDERGEVYLVDHGGAIYRLVGTPR